MPIALADRLSHFRAEHSCETKLDPVRGDIQISPPLDAGRSTDVQVTKSASRPNTWQKEPADRAAWALLIPPQEDKTGHSRSPRGQQAEKQVETDRGNSNLVSHDMVSTARNPLRRVCQTEHATALRGNGMRDAIMILSTSSIDHKDFSPWNDHSPWIRPAHGLDNDLEDKMTDLPKALSLVHRPSRNASPVQLQNHSGKKEVSPCLIAATLQLTSSLMDRNIAPMSEAFVKVESGERMDNVSSLGSRDVAYFQSISQYGISPLSPATSIDLSEADVTDEQEEHRAQVEMSAEFWADKVIEGPYELPGAMSMLVSHPVLHEQRSRNTADQQGLRITSELTDWQLRSPPSSVISTPGVRSPPLSVTGVMRRHSPVFPTSNTYSRGLGFDSTTIVSSPSSESLVAIGVHPQQENLLKVSTNPHIPIEGISELPVHADYYSGHKVHHNDHLQEMQLVKSSSLHCTIIGPLEYRGLDRDQKSVNVQLYPMSTGPHPTQPPQKDFYEEIRDDYRAFSKNAYEAKLATRLAKSNRIRRLLPSLAAPKFFSKSKKESTRTERVNEGRTTATIPGYEGGWL